MELLGYSERGFINAFFYGVFHHPEPAVVMGSFLRLVQWPLLAEPPALTHDASADAVLVEQSYSDFGDADATILCSAGEDRAVFFCEAKRGREFRLGKEWDDFTTRFRHGYTGGVSNAFRQLYLKQRLVGALVGGDDLTGGIEFDGVLQPVRGNRRRKLGHNTVVRRAVDMVRRYLGQAYYLLLTPEAITPRLVEGLRAAHSFAPAPAEPKPRGWDLTRWGLVSVQEMVALCQSSGMRHAVEVARFNDGQLF